MVKMILVIHYPSRDPDVIYDVTENGEKRALKALEKDWIIERSSSELWPGQDNPRYSIHHYNVKRKR